MAPTESRLPPLSEICLDCGDVKERPLKRNHSFAGYVPYYLNEELAAASGAFPLADAFEAASSTSVDATSSTSAGSDESELDGSPKASDPSTWPDTDDEEVGGCHQHGSSSPLHANAYVQPAWPDTDEAWEGPVPAGLPTAWAPVMAPVLLLQGAGIARARDTKVIVGLGAALAEAAAEGDREGTSVERSCFNIVGEPALSIQDFLWRLCRCSGCSQDCLVLSLAYISSATELNPGKVDMNSRTVHRLLVAAMTIAVKFHDGNMCSNQIFAEASGLEIQELNLLEATLLQLLQGKLHVDSKTFARLRGLLRIASG